MRPVGLAVARTSGRGLLISEFYHNEAVLGFGGPLTAGRFRRRLSRFSVAVQIDGELVTAHLPNSGRLGELLIDGAPVWLEARAGPSRRTAWDLALVEYDGALVSLDSRLPNALLARAIAAGCINGIAQNSPVRREITIGRSRLDFVLGGPAEQTYVEVKSVTLVVDGCARFPDAPTVRGARHLAELAALRTAGHGAMAVFIILRPDAEAFAPNMAGDPAFAAALHAAVAAGVEVRAYRCLVTLEGITLLDQVPVLLETPTAPSPSGRGLG